MSLAIVARCDASGLSVLTSEVFRNLMPDRTLLLDLPDGQRGDCYPSTYDLYGSTYQQVYPAEFSGGLPERAVEWLCAEGVDTLWSAEWFYDDAKVLRAAGHAGIHSVCYAMPELAVWAADPGRRPRPQTLHVPTDYRLEHMPSGTEVLPMPVARDRLPFRERTDVTHLLHPTGAAMEDRHGTMILLRALAFVEAPLRLTIKYTQKWLRENGLNDPAEYESPRHIKVEWISDNTPNYWDAYPHDTDLLVLPRRYGGLSLPLQECASLGIPSLTLQSDPYSSFDFVHAIPTTRSRLVRMKGCLKPGVPVFDADPRVLAAAIDRLVQHPELQAAASRAADAWAEAHAWSGPLGLEWCERLSANCMDREQAA